MPVFGPKPFDAEPLIRHMVDATVPNKTVTRDHRQQLRFSRAIPVVITAAHSSGKPNIKDSAMALTQDISFSGFALISFEVIETGSYFVSIWPEEVFPEPIHFGCDALASRQITHGFWCTGMEIGHAYTARHGAGYAQLDRVARNALRPPICES